MLPTRAMSNDPTRPEGPRAIIELPGGESVAVSLPAGEVPAYAVLPALRVLVNAMMQRVKDVSAARGETITCRAGCGACCRQYVPISDMEARALAELLERMPEDRQARVRARFAEAETRLREAGLWDRLAEGGRMLPSEHVPLVQNYFHLGVACPFLEDEACSIYPDRPLICREYLVVSPSIHCERLERKQIKRLAAPQTSRALHVMDGAHDPENYNVFPLVAALDWLRRHPEEPERRTAEAWINHFGHAMQHRFGDSVEMVSRPPPEASEEW
jgi:Fe-S-cluster containining protein